MKCKKCGYENKEEALYCNLCYEVLKKEHPKVETNIPVIKTNNKLTTILLIFILVLVIVLVSVLNILNNFFDSIKYEQKIIVIKKEPKPKSYLSYLENKTLAKDTNSSESSMRETVKEIPQVDPVDFNTSLPPNTKYSFYSIKGTTFKELFQDICHPVTGKGLYVKEAKLRAPAYIQYNFTWSAEYIFDGMSYKWKKIDIKPYNTIFLPLWYETNAKDINEIYLWRDFLNKIKNHEITHAKINNNNVHEFINIMTIIRANSKKELEEKTDAEYKKFREKVAFRNSRYDEIAKLSKKIFVDIFNNEWK